MNHFLRHIKLFTLLLCLVVVFMLHGCMHDSQTENYPTVSFISEVQPIIASNCTQSGCHGYVETEEFSLVTYQEIVNKVNPGNGRKSDLYRAITGRSPDFMPPSPSQPLTDAQIRTIFVWIEQGANDN